MQARELTSQEVREGEQNITERDLNATQVQALVRQMDQSKQRWKRMKRNKVEYEEKLKSENSQLYFNYPSLFQMHAEDRLDSTFFEMLQLKRRIEKGEITAEQASSVVGQTLFQRYVPHVLSNQEAPVPHMSYEEYYRQFQSNS